MSFYVYIIQSEKDLSYYKGFSENPIFRLAQHNAGEAKYTSAKIPWTLIHVEVYATKTEALVREKKLKKYSHNQIANLMLTPLNVVAKFSD